MAKTNSTMLLPTVSIVLILTLSGQALSLAVKGHSSAAHLQQQRAVEQAPIKSPVQAERQPKAAAPAQPILESSKKVYNDEAIRRSAASQQLQQQVISSEPAAKSAAPVVVPEPVVPVVQSAPVVAPVVVAPAKPEPNPVPIVQFAAASAVVPVVVAAKESVAEKKPEQQAQVEPKSAAVTPVKPVVEPVKPVELPIAKADKDELPAQSVRSVPIKEEQVSKVIVEQVVPSKVAEAPVMVPIVPVVPTVPVVAPVVPIVPVVEQPVQPVQSPAVEQQQPVAVKPVAQDSPMQAKRDEPVAQAAAAKPIVEPIVEPAIIEVPAPDPGLILSEPIDSTTKLLIDLDEHVQKFLPAEDKQEPSAPAKDQVLVSGVDYSPAAAADAQQQPSGKSGVPLVPYSSVNEQEPIVPPLPQSIDKVEKASGVVSGSSGGSQSAQSPANTRQASSSSSSSSHQHQNQQQVITQLLDQLDSLQNRIQDTINQLVARRRYVMSALLRPMGTYVRRVRTNLERLQNRVNQLQAAAVSVGGNQNGQRPGGFVDAAAIETIRRRIDDISKRISDIVNRIRFSLTPTSAPLNNNGK